MKLSMEEALQQTCWFVGAATGAGDETERFISEGIWENGYEDKYLDVVRTVRSGDLIAIKSSYVRKNNLPFDNKGLPVSTMAIKAIGKVLKNPGDGRHLKVEWWEVDPPWEWYFFTNRTTIWKVEADDWMREALIEFTFANGDQDYQRFCNDPYWADRFGKSATAADLFPWTRPYEVIADALLRYKDNRKPLVKALHRISRQVDKFTVLDDKDEDGNLFPLEDICPFTIMGIFNRQITEDNRREALAHLAEFLQLDLDPIVDFRGIPRLNNQRSWFFGFKFRRDPDDIDNLWRVFKAAVKYADNPNADTEDEFAEAFDTAEVQWGVKWNLSTGLYWIRPWFYPTLDAPSREYITRRLRIPIGSNSLKRKHASKVVNSSEYLELKDRLESRFQEADFPAHSFPELSHQADIDTNDYDRFADDDEQEDDAVTDDLETQTEAAAVSYQPYSSRDIIADGCFLTQQEVDGIIERLRSKRNLILQGPPGTGKTWLARRLAFALMGEKAKPRVRSVQFHPNLSYEDFVRGWRPSGDGRLDLVDGPFLEIASQALQDAANQYVLVIEEINRGHPAQIFGELLTLIEADKRTPDAAIELSYATSGDKPMYVPANLYIIGTMNIADRSLALVDYALRRRFAFWDLEPRFGEPWRKWLSDNHSIDIDLCRDFERRINALNQTITDSTSLGRQYCIGHSYLTPARGQDVKDPVSWFRQVVNTEIVPLLSEYWYDKPDVVATARQDLLRDL